ncbi:MAG: hypothetical protein ACK4MV_17150 [Beijerinckiaceae bacterium]
MTDTNIGRQSGAGNDAMTRARQAASSASETASDIAGQASGFASKAASALASEAQNKAAGLMQQQMRAGADYVQLVCETAHSAAGDLEDKAPELARMVRDAARRAEDFAEHLRRRDAEEMIDMAWDYARRNPRMFLGGAIAAGFLLARFAKSSAERSASMSRRYEPAHGSSSFTPRSAATGYSGKPDGSAGGAASVRSTSGGASYAG